MGAADGRVIELPNDLVTGPPGEGLDCPTLATLAVLIGANAGS
jgi:hypothetical protein